MTAEEAVKWLEEQGFRVRQHGQLISAWYGEVSADTNGIRVWGNVSAQVGPENDGRWMVSDHGRVVGRFGEFDQALHALRDYLIELNRHLGSE